MLNGVQTTEALHSLYNPYIYTFPEACRCFPRLDDGEPIAPCLLESALPDPMRHNSFLNTGVLISTLIELVYNHRTHHLTFVAI